MPVPPKSPIQYVCAYCDWKGPQVTSDVLLPLVCPDCGSKAVLKPMSAPSLLRHLVDKLLRLSPKYANGWPQMQHLKYGLPIIFKCFFCALKFSTRT